MALSSMNSTCRVEYVIRITIEAYDKAGHNLDTVLLNAAYAVNLSFIPTMSAQRLLDGYRSILKRMYAPDAYYERVRRFLERYHPTNRTRRSLSEYLAFCRSVVKQGMLGDARASYWKFIIDVATRYRHAFGTAVTLAIMGYHFYTVTEEACRTV
jgi:hypothetical protein